MTSRKLVYAVLALLVAAGPVLAQTAALRGQVTDESGAVIPGAKVTLNGPSGLVKTTTSGNDGSYSFIGLSPGSYSIDAAAPELTLAQPAKITLKSGGQTLNLQLRISSTKQQVTVQDNPGPTVSADPANNASALVLRGEDLDALSNDPDDLHIHLGTVDTPLNALGESGTADYADLVLERRGAKK